MKEKNASILALVGENTVVSEYKPTYEIPKYHQSEKELEEEFIRTLQEQGYEWADYIKTPEHLKDNLRKQLSKLNDYVFTDSEWERLYVDIIKGDQIDKTHRIQGDAYIRRLIRDDESIKNILLIDKKRSPNKNTLQVINQYRDANVARYDVTILVNGLPLVHIELKRKGIDLREAFNQIDRYKDDSFARGLFEYVQIFVISNGTSTRYYSNTTRASRKKGASEVGAAINPKEKNSFEFTSSWSDEKNHKISYLTDFAKHFFAQVNILRILFDFCVFNVENNLLVLRPYQICAIDKIIQKIRLAISHKLKGKEARGYIWHTTGSGKTLTSFKAAQIAGGMPGVDKVLFIVDRKDLNKQTIDEYEKFKKGSTASTRDAKALKERLESTDKDKIIVTTIQKLNIFVKTNNKHEIFDKRLVLIFDECHRSQAGMMNRKITEKFKNAHLFGFTGTPIFRDDDSKVLWKKNDEEITNATEDLFGEQLHYYNIRDAIYDGNVLPFRVDFMKTAYAKENIEDENVKGIDKKAFFEDDDRIREIVKYTLEQFDRKTLREPKYDLKERRNRGFNSIFAAASIDLAKKYYLEFQRQIKQLNNGLIVAVIFSNGCENKEEHEDLDQEELDDFKVDGLSGSSKEFLKEAIETYNKSFENSSNFSVEGFDKYYFDVSERVKNREIDLLIVVNMFLTGFDAPTMNTLWIDKNLSKHNLIQAFSRTNRVVNKVKQYGNIICFRDLEPEVEKALKLYMSCVLDNDENVAIYPPFEKIYPQYEEAIRKLLTDFPKENLFISPEEEKNFIDSFGEVLKARQKLKCYDEFKDEKEILTEGEIQDYISKYTDLMERYRSEAELENINDDVVFEIELIKQIEIDVEYLNKKLAEIQEARRNKQIERAEKMEKDLDRFVSASPTFRNKKDLIDDFLQLLRVQNESSWDSFVEERFYKELDEVISSENLKKNSAQQLIKEWLKTGEIRDTGTQIDEVMPYISRKQMSKRFEIKTRIIDRLVHVYRKFFELRKPNWLPEDFEE